MTGTESGRFDDLPPSAKYVHYVLEEDAPLTREELLDETGLCERTLDRALDRLQDGNYIRSDRDNSDLRQVVVTTATTRTLNQSRD